MLVCFFYPANEKNIFQWSGINISIGEVGMGEGGWEERKTEGGEVFVNSEFMRITINGPELGDVNFEDISKFVKKKKKE